jgi:glutathione S-transferase
MEEEDCQVTGHDVNAEIAGATTRGPDRTPTTLQTQFKSKTSSSSVYAPLVTSTTIDTLSTLILNPGRSTHIQCFPNHQLMNTQIPSNHHQQVTYSFATLRAMSGTKKIRTHPQYELLYHPGIPGRGEFIRLCFEATGVSFTDVAVEKKDGYSDVQAICMNKGLESSDGNPPVFSPPALRVPGAGKDGKALVISQTPNILIYLAERLGLVPDDEAGTYHVYQLAFTALDLNNEIHDTHHPLAVMKYYEEQKEAALQKAADVRENRLPKFFSYFERNLKHNEKTGGGQHKYLVGSRLTFADLVVWQVLDGVSYSFPKEIEARRKEFPELLVTFYDSVKEGGLKEYLQSDRRMPYSEGIFRHYPELDRQ